MNKKRFASFSRVFSKFPPNPVPLVCNAIFYHKCRTFGTWKCISIIYIALYQFVDPLYFHMVAVQTAKNTTLHSGYIRYLPSKPCACPPTGPSGFYNLMWFIIYSLNKLFHRYPITAPIFSPSFCSGVSHSYVPCGNAVFHSAPIKENLNFIWTGWFIKIENWICCWFTFIYLSLFSLTCVKF